MAYSRHFVNCLSYRVCYDGNFLNEKVAFVDHSCYKAFPKGEFAQRETV